MAAFANDGSGGYLTSSLVDVHITKVVSPIIYWCKIIPRPTTELSHYEMLQTDMNDHFENYDPIPMVPCQNYPARGDIVVVQSSVDRCWYRARVEFVVQAVHGIKVKSFLVDRGESILVKPENIRRIPEKYLDCPFQAIRIALDHLQPIGLRVNAKDGLAVTKGPLETWDDASYIFVEKIVKSYPVAKLEILSSLTQNDVVGKLFFTHLTESSDLPAFCLNKELVSQGYASFSECQIDLEMIMAVESRSPSPSSVNNSTKTSPKKRLDGSSPRSSEDQNSNLDLWKKMQEDLDRKILDAEDKPKPEPVIPKSVAGVGRGRGFLKLLHELTQSKARESERSPREKNLTLGPEKISPRISPRPYIASSPVLSLVSKHVQTRLSPRQLDVNSLNKISPSISPNRSTRNFGYLEASPDSRDSRFESPERGMFSPTSVFDQQAVMDHSSMMKEVLVCGAAPPKAAPGIQQTFLDDHLKTRLRELKAADPSPLQSLVWPATLRLRHVAIVGPPRSGKTLSYLVPLISSLLQPKIYENLPMSNSPFALIVCAQMSTARNIFDKCKTLLETSSKVALQVNLLQSSSMNGFSQARLMNGCKILIATPHYLLQLLKNTPEEMFNLSRLCHLILDESHLLMKDNSNLVGEIMSECLKTLSKKRKPLWQIVICGERWTPIIPLFVRCNMLQPLAYFSSFLEAVVFANTRIKAEVCRSSVQDIKLKEILTLISSKKTVISTTSTEVAKWIHQYISPFCYTLLLHPELDRYDLEEIHKKWRTLEKDAMIVIADNSLPDCKITDATCLIHYDLPVLSKSIFGHRFRLLFQEIQKSVHADDLEHQDKKNSDDLQQVDNNILSYVFVTEKNAEQAPSLLNFLERLRSSRPSKLLQAFAAGSFNEKEASSSELCVQWKAFGTCSKIRPCRYRHTLLQTDAPRIPTSGQVTILITDVRHASRYYGRLLSHKKEGAVTDYKIHYLKLWSELKNYYAIAENRQYLKSVSVGEVCGLYMEEELQYFRVEIIQKQIDSDVSVRFVDSGRTLLAKASQLLYLSETLKEIPFQAIEIYVCNVQPIDNEFVWDPEANHYIHGLIMGKELTGNVQMALNSTIWVNQLVAFKYLEEVKAHVVDLSVPKELKNKFALEYRYHMTELQKAYSETFSVPEDSCNLTTPTQEDKQVSAATSLLYETLSLDNYECVGVVFNKSPSTFYVQKINCLDKLNKLKKEPSTAEGISPATSIERGNVYLTPAPPDCENGWDRVLVEEVTDDGKIHVLNIDSGESLTVGKENIYTADSSVFERLPAQAIKCSLYGIEPIEDDWSREVVDAFMDMVMDSDDNFKDLFVKVIKPLDTAEKNAFGLHHYAVVLYNTDGNEEILLNEELVQLGYAKKVDDVAAGGWPHIPSTDTCGDPAEDVVLDREDTSRSSPDNLCNLLQDINDTSKGAPARAQWYQTNTEITIKFQINDLQHYILNNADSSLYFNAVVQDKCYINNMHLYAHILPCTKKESLSGQGLSVTFCKAVHGKWPRLLNSVGKVYWLTADFDHFDYSSCDETDDEKITLPATTDTKTTVNDVWRRIGNANGCESTDDEDSDLSGCDD